MFRMTSQIIKEIILKKFALLLLLSLAIPAISPAMATPITKDAANAYFQNCQAQPAQGLSPKSKEFLCACTAAKMMESMSVEDVKAMSQQNQTGRNAMNNMLINVYAPCMGAPAKDHYYNTCISNPQTKLLGRNPQRLCGCMSDEVSTYLATNGPKVFRDLLSRNPNMVDPMTALTNDTKFQQFAQSKLMGCVR